MPAKVAVINAKHIRWKAPITVNFGFTGIDSEEAAMLARRRIREQFEILDFPLTCVYVVRLKGPVAVTYGEDFSPVIYIGEGDAEARLTSHAEWIAQLLLAVPNAEIEVRYAECVRRGKDLNAAFSQYVEADLIDWFVDKYQCLPWFNKQREPKYQGKKTYSKAVERELKSHIGKVKGSRFIWSIQPTHNNEQSDSYLTGWY
jgi:hypothetical protein